MKLSAPGGEPETMPASAVLASAEPRELDVARLYDEHAPFLGRVILRLLGDGTHVDDLLQETFIVAFQKRFDFDPRRAAPTTWLYGIASNMCRRHKRGARRFSSMQDRLAKEQGPATAPSPDDALAREQDIALVQSAIDLLPFKQREVFVLFEIEELSGKEIAELVGIPLGTVWTRLHDARDRFQRHLERRQDREDRA